LGRFDDRRPVAGSSDLFVARDAAHGGVERALHVVEITPARAAALRARVREASQLSHPHLARWVTVGEEDGKVLLAREWVAGPALAPGMDPQEAGRLLVQVLDALAHAHWHDLHHGAVRPSCLLRDGDGRVVLADLGLAPHGSAQGDLRGIADTLEALAPDLPDALAGVVASTHAGAYPTARDQQHALKQALLADPGPAWGRWLLGGSLLLAMLMALLMCWGRGSTPSVPTPPPPVTTAVPSPAPAPVVAPIPPASPPVPKPSPTPRRPAPPSPEPEPEPVPEPVPEPQVVVIPVPVPITVVVPAPVPEPVPEVVPEPAPPVPAPQPMPTSLPATGKWTVEGDGAGGFVLRLIADQAVQDRLGRSGRAVFEVRCARGKARVTLHPGVRSVERIMVDGIDSQQVLVRADLGPLGVRKLKFATEEGRPLSLGRRGSSWLSDAGGLTEVRLTYTPFASDAVVAPFDWRGFDVAWAQAGAACE